MLPACFSAAVPLFTEPAGQLVHELPASLYAFVEHTVQLESELEPGADSVPAADPVPAGQSKMPGEVVLVPTGPPPAQYLFAGHEMGVSLSGVP